MIADAVALQEVRASWQGVEALRGKVQRSMLGAFGEGSSFATFATDAANNLPFVHACAVLNDVLEQLATEGHFRCKSIFLGALLAASKPRLTWLDYPLIAEAAERRRQVAHEGAIVPRGECWRYIDAIKAQLEAWTVL